MVYQTPGLFSEKNNNTHYQKAFNGQIATAAEAKKLKLEVDAAKIGHLIFSEMEINNGRPNLIL